MKKDVALITGASRGIGLAAARQLAKDGYRVGIISTGPQERYPDAVAALKADGAEFYWFSGDLGSSADRARIAREAVQTLGEIRILVNNAGVAPKTRTDLLEMTEESYDRVLGVNTKGGMFFTQLIAKHMIGLSMEGRVKRGTERGSGGRHPSGKLHCTPRCGSCPAGRAAGACGSRGTDLGCNGVWHAGAAARRQL